MKKLLFVLAGCLMLLGSCSPKLLTSISKSYPALDYLQEIRVYDLQNAEPDDAEYLGMLKSGNSGLTPNCDYESVIEKAKAEARKIGGNALKITAHNIPGVLGTPCHQITARILRVNDWEISQTTLLSDSSMLYADFALLHVYRFSGFGPMVNYDLYLGDSMICRIKNKTNTTIQIHKDGLNTIWAQTEAKTEMPINIKFGNEYYIRCSLTTGVLMSRPKFELVDNKTGLVEFESVK